MHRVGVAGQQVSIHGERRVDGFGQLCCPAGIGCGPGVRTDEPVEERGEIARRGRGELAVRRYPARGVGDMHDPGRRLRRAERAVAEPEIQRRAHHEDQVRLAERELARAGDEQLVPGREYAAGLPVRDHRQSQFPGQPPGRRLGAAQPHVRAQHQYRPPRAPQQRRYPPDILAVRSRRHQLALR